MAVKTKTSKIKQKNIKKTKLYKQGKIKSHNKKVTFLKKKSNEQVNQGTFNNEPIDGANILRMIDTKDLEFLKKAVSDPSYSIYSKISNRSKGEKRKKELADIDNIEEQYEKEIQAENLNPKRTRHLLPVKTSVGLVRRTVVEDVPDEDDGVNNEEKESAFEDGDKEMSEAEDFLMSDDEGEDVKRPLSAAELLARREQLLTQYKLRIGLLASGLLEDPQNKIKNISLLMDLMNHCKPEVRLSVQKLVFVSLTEVFKDILPSYQIKHHEDSTVKLKKNTKTLHGYEKSLLKGYKLFLVRLEKFAKVLIKKKGDTRVQSEQVLRLGELCISCVCELLTSHPYFNLSRNMVQMLAPFLNSPRETIRLRVAACFGDIFRDDKRGDLTLDIVRRINHLVKSRGHVVHREVVSVLLALRIKDVNLDREKEAEVKQKKFMTHKQKLLAMSKRERKRAKKLEELEKELLETKAEENKENKQKNLTEVMKVVFTIYFRILKKAPSSKVLSSALEGLAKFAHCINYEFFSDLVGVLDGLMEAGTLHNREKLYCVQTVFAILSGQGEALNIDPSTFYTHLYNNLFYIHVGKTHEDMLIVLRVLENILIQRRKKITHQRLLAFTKRLAILATQTLHNGSVGALAVIRRVMQLGMGVDVLLDVDSTLGQGVYDPTLQEPEHCNAASSALWELTLLQRHYHPSVRLLARYVLTDNDQSRTHLPPDIAKLNPVQLFEHFDPSQVMFKPSIPPPAKNITGTVKLKEVSSLVRHLSKQAIPNKSEEANDMSSLHKEVSKYFKNETRKRSCVSFPHTASGN